VPGAPSSLTWPDYVVVAASLAVLLVIGFALASILLALALGYIISWSLIGPVKQIEAQLKHVAAGHFTHRVDVVNRDELGTLGR